MDSPTSAQTPPLEDKPSKRSRRPVACKKCHSLKVKCTPADENDPAGPCIRCVNSNRVCEIDLNQSRKRRRKHTESKSGGTSAVKNNGNPQSNPTFDTNNEVMRLQQEVARLTNELELERKSKRTKPPSKYVSKNDLEKEINILSSTSSHILEEITHQTKKVLSRKNELLNLSEKMDVVSKGIISLQEAQERLNLYKEKIYTKHPLVEVPDMPIEMFVESQPILFNAFMAISNTVISREAETDVCLAIDNTAIESVTREVLVAGQKKVEHVKALLLLSLWYNTPELFRNRRYHMLNIIAVQLLHDLGMVGKPSLSLMANGKKVFETNRHINTRDNSPASVNGTINSADTTDSISSSNSQKLEYRKVILILYFSTVSVCLILRRAIFVNWTPYVEECCQLLETSDNPDNQYVALYSRLNHQLERIHHVIHAPDRDILLNSQSYIVQELQKNLEIIKEKIPNQDYLLLSYYYSVEAYLHEPYLANIVPSDPAKGKLSYESVNAVSRCTGSCMKALEMFNLLSPTDIATIPMSYISRVIYTAGMLLRLRYLVLSLPSHIEKELVSQKAITSIQNVSTLINEASELNNCNYFLKKTRIILLLFTHTYARQVQELLKSSGDTPENFKSPASIDESFRKSNDINGESGGELLTQSGKTYSPSFLSLEMLSQAASSFNKEDNSTGEKPFANKVMEKPQSVPPRYKFNTSVLPSGPVLSSYMPSGSPSTMKPPQSQYSQQSQQQASFPYTSQMDPNNTSSGAVAASGAVASSAYMSENGASNNNGNDSINSGTPDGQNTNQYAIPSNFNNTIRAFENFTNQDQLEMSYLNLNDEFWADILSSDKDKINFSINSNSDQFLL